MSTHLCFACMNPLESHEAVCPHCGHDNHIRDNGPGMLRGGLLAGKYLVGKILGRGGFGATYLGYDTSLERPVAIKEYLPSHLVVREGNSADLSVVTGAAEEFARGRERALKESRMAARLGQIPGIVQTYDVFPENNTIYIVMEYVEGDTLTKYVEKQPEKLSLSRAMTLLAQVGTALSTLHHRKIIHRDVKPDNIIIRNDPEQGVLLDFGAAKVDDGTTLGNSSAVVSPGFAPPEQYNAASLDGRIDQYAFAATLYYTLTGQRPADSIMRLVSSTPLPSIRQYNPGVPEAAEKAIMKGMAVKEQDRYATMEDFLAALEKAAGVKGGKKLSGKYPKDKPVPPDPTSPESEKPSPDPDEQKPQNKKGLMGILAGVALGLLAAVLVFVLAGDKCEHQWVDGTCVAVSYCSKCGESIPDSFGGHQWVTADCVTPKTCEICQATSGSALGHSWVEATCELPKTCGVCAATEGTALGHSWVEATCELPKTCGVCAATEGTALGHSWSEATCELPKTCGVCAATEGTALGHSWSEATCELPKTCNVCSMTDGKALGHDWQNATCTKPKTCKVCSKTEGNALGHSWVEATYTSPKTCTTCAATEGKKKDGAPVVLSAGGNHTVGINPDGTVVAKGEKGYGQVKVTGWADIVQVSAGKTHTVGLKSDGTVVAVGENFYGKCDVNGWKDIVQISAGERKTLGLKADGTVVMAGPRHDGDDNVSSWTDIVQISAGDWHTVGLKSDGTVMAVGDNYHDQCNVSKWTDIVQISAGNGHTVGLKSDGTVMAVGLNTHGQCNVSKWTDIVQISAGNGHTVGLKSDGTVMAVGDNYYDQCNVSDWTDIVQISAGDYHTVGLKSDGTGIGVGYNDYGQCNVFNWHLMPIDPNTTNDSSSSVNSQLATANIGDYVTFGKYEQDGDISNGKEDIEWLVLDKQDDRILVISRYGLDNKPYNQVSDAATWETCSLRSWLNEDFFNSAFNDSEQEIILTVTLNAEKHPSYPNISCKDTQDKIFLLSVNEATSLFATNNSRKCEPTPYALNQGAWTSNQGFCWWWLRTPGTGYSTKFINNGGGVGVSGAQVNGDCTVRPAMWIDLNP